MFSRAHESVSNQVSEQRPRKRVRMACNRCRRQKLKCDTQRPCALCQRSGVECVTDSRDMYWCKGQDKDPAVDRGGPLTTRSSRNDQITAEVPTPNSRSLNTPSQPTSIPETDLQEENPIIPPQFRRDTSAVKLTQEILQQLSPDASLNTDTSALPGGSCGNTPLSPDTFPINQILGLNIPSKAVADDLLNAYFESVHWFMVLFHEPSFRQRYDAIILAGQASPKDLPFLVCLMLLLAIGARYLNPTSNHSPELDSMDLDALQKDLLNSTRKHLLDIVELGGVEGVQICVLLSTFYLYHDRPNLAFAIHGMGVKCAHTMNLHQEAAWKEATTLTREIKRRVWWALYVVDCFYSIIFGRPRSIRDEESHVAMVRNLEDTAARHPGFNSTETIGESSYPVTVFSYQRYKFTLYIIAARVMRDIYFSNSSTSLTPASDTIQSIYQDLESWFQTLPPELKHPSDHDSDFVIQQDQEPQRNNVVKIFRLQAMTLQLAYDNIQILLHRPLLQLPIGLHSTPHLFQGMRNEDTSDAMGNAMNESDLRAVDSATLAASKSQCYKSALRTACLNFSIVQEARYTHAASYIGIQIFTAGMVLSVVALSAPLSTEAQQAKRAIGRIVSTAASIGNQTLLSAQSQQILKRLVRLILEKEMNSIFAEPSGHVSTLNTERTTFKNPSQPVPINTAPVSTQHKGDNLESPISTSIVSQELDINRPLDQRGEAGSETQYNELAQGTWNDMLPTEGFDYDQAISSVRQVFFQTRPSQVNGSDWSDYHTNSSLLTESLDPNDVSSRPFYLPATGNGLQEIGQAWLWEDGPLQPLNMDNGEQST